MAAICAPASSALTAAHRSPLGRSARRAPAASASPAAAALGHGAPRTHRLASQVALVGGRGLGQRSVHYPTNPRRHGPKRIGPVCALTPELIQTVLTSNSPGLAAGLLLNTAVFVGGIKVLLSGLTPSGVVYSWVLGTTIFSAFGARGYALVCLYFIFGSLVTKIKLEQKQAEGIAEARGGRRGPGSVWGSGVAGVACALAALAVGPGAALEPALRLGFVASFASKLSDTTSSEVGKAYGKTTYLSTPPFKLVPRGTEGAVSLEGTLGGAAAAGGFALVALMLGQVDGPGAVTCIAAAVLANAFESALGATVQGQVEWLSNDVVNMLQITLAAAIAVAISVAS